MNPEEMRSNNARLGGDDIEAKSTNYDMLNENMGLKRYSADNVSSSLQYRTLTAVPVYNLRHECNEGDSGEKTVIIFTDTKIVTTLLNTITRHKSLEVLVISLSCAEDFIQEHAAYNFLAIIFCHSVKSENRLSHLEIYLGTCCEKFGQEKVSMVITDLEDTKTAKKVEREWSTGNYAGCQLLTLTEAEVDGIKNPLIGKTLTKTNSLRQILLNARDISSKPNFNKPKLQIGIFSRSDQEDYSWLVSLLRSEIFRDLVEDVRPCGISNNGFQQFKNDVQQCTFTILYHTITRGRINITDMGKSSLYDKELEHLHEQLGQEKVIVVIDDLRDSSDQMKTCIKQEQPSIGRLARDLFLFSNEEKESDYVRCLPTFQKKMRKLNTMMLNEDLEVYEDRKEKGADMEIHLGQNVQNQYKDGNSAAKPAGRIHSGQDEQSAHLSQRTSMQKKIPTNEQRSEAVQTLEVTTTNLCNNAVPYHTQEVYEDRKEKGADMEIHLGQNVQNQYKDGNSSAKPAGRIHSRQEVYEDSKEKGADMKIRLGQNVQNQYKDGNSAAKPAGRIHSGQGRVPYLFSQLSKKHVVGFFSSSSEEDYSWLMAMAKPHAKKMYNYYIGNSGFHHFMHDVQQCTFGILYHTMTRGRINITDVKDAIYDRHLEYMSSQLGKEKVIVMIDDVVDSSDQEKARILETQPSIRRLARDLILINKQDKMMCGDIDDTKTCRLS